MFEIHEMDEEYIKEEIEDSDLLEEIEVHDDFSTKQERLTNIKFDRMDEVKRGKNFTNLEKNILCDLILKKKDIINNKKTDSNTLHEKRVAWEIITQKFNSSSITGPRTPKQLKELYAVLKRNAKKNFIHDKIETYKNGDGVFEPKCSALDHKVIAAFDIKFEPDNNPFDSSSKFYSEDASLTESPQIVQACNNTPKVSSPISSQDSVISIIPSSPPNIIVRNFQPIAVTSVPSQNLCLSPTSTIINSCKPIKPRPIVSSQNFDVSIKSSSSPPTSRRVPTLKKTPISHFQLISNSIANRKKQKSKFDYEIQQKKIKILDLELEMKTMVFEKTTEIFDLEKKEKLMNLRIKELELKIKECEYRNIMEKRM